MNSTLLAGPHSSRTPQGGKLACLLMLVLMQLTLVHAALNPVAETVEPKAHGDLLRLAATDPLQEVSIIVRAEPGSSALSDLVQRTGGTITSQFPLINGFSATVRAGTLAELALHPELVWISPDSNMVEHNCVTCATINANQINTWAKAIDLEFIRNDPANSGLQGQGITVAVIDSGVAASDDFKDSNGNSRILMNVAVVNGVVTSTPPMTMTTDAYGHGTHVAGLIAGDGRLSGGQVVGVAPRANIISVRVNDKQGITTGSDVINALQWVHDNRTNLNIRVVNLSLNSDTYETQHTAALNAAVEMLWFAGITVVVSAGNNGNNGVLYPPANDPFVVTVGAVDSATNKMATFSARGAVATNLGNFVKPEVMAPGVNLVSLGCPTCTLNTTYPSNVPAGFTGSSNYFRATGTSMSAALVSGVVALMYQKNPGISPDQVKYRLWHHSREVPETLTRYLDAKWTITSSTSTNTLNTNVEVAAPLVPADNPLAVYDWGYSSRWGSSRWGSSRWGSARWSSTFFGKSSNSILKPGTATPTPTPASSAPTNTVVPTPSRTPTTAVTSAPSATASRTPTRTSTSVAATASRTATRTSTTMATATPTRTSTTMATATATGCQMANVALWKSSFASSQDGGNGASNAVDNNATTLWVSGKGDPNSITVDLGTTQTICRVVLRWDVGYATQYRIELSNDNNNWAAPMYITWSGDGGLDDLTGLNGSGRFLRLYSMSRSRWDKGNELFELEIYTK